MAEALTPAFDHLDELLGEPIDRNTLVEALVRLQLSTLLVPADENWTRFLDESPQVLEKWVLKFTRQIV